ncbi:MAG: hypothetical protein ABI615_09560 [Chthoniobacterales bacterium]
MKVLFRYALWLLAGAVGFFVAGGIALWLLHARLTHYVESASFRQKMDKSTSKGLHFTGQYGPFRRTGLFSVASESFKAGKGEKALESLSAHIIAAEFNPWGIFLRRWQIDSIHIESGEVQTQIYEPKPEKKSPKPWYSIFLPDHVYLKEVVCDTAKVTWQFRDEEGGFYKTRLRITPHGRDFEYDASGGKMKMALMPDLSLIHMHMLITKEWLTLYKLHLAQGEEGNIEIEAKAGLKDDAQTEGRVHFYNLPVGPWIPSSWKASFEGITSGEVSWKSKNRKLQSSSGYGTLNIRGGHVTGVPLLEEMAALTKKESLKSLHLDSCSLNVKWDYPHIEIKDIDIEAKGIFRIHGQITLEGRTLIGRIQFGAVPEYLEWLPKAEEVFTSKGGGYLLTTVRFSGTADNPQQDLSPRMTKVLKESPGAYVGTFFRLFGEWMENFFTGKKK